MFNGPEIAATLVELGVTHVVWLPDSDLGPWEAALESADGLTLLRVCREGEAWPLAAGLQVGGMSPVVMIQTTGLFESGDALRNIVYDLKVPVFSVIGVRNWLNENSPDTARRFTEPIIKAWDVDAVWIRSAEDKPKLAAHYIACREANRAGMVLIAE